MSNAHPDHMPGAVSDTGPLLASLRQGQVRFAVVGPAPARGRRGDPAGAAEAANPVLSIIPEPSASNLQLLAAVLSEGLDARLRTAAAPGGGLPLRVSAALFTAIPVLPLTTSLGPLNVLSHPPATDRDLLADTTGVAEVTTGALPFHVPLTGIASVAADNLPASPLVAGSPAMAAGLRHDFDHNALREGDLEELILSTLAEDDTPRSIREILLLVPPEKKVPYKRIKTAAETLVSQGHLLRAKSGTAHRYRLHTHTDSDEEVARRIHALLADRTDPQAILHAALAMSLSTEESSEEHPR